MMYFLIGLVFFIGPIFIRAIMFKPSVSEVENIEYKDLDQEAIISRFQKMISFKTISDYDLNKMDMQEFIKFQKALDEMYPEILKVCEKKLIGPTGILYKWKGHSSDKPVVLMSHYDVVPVEYDYWMHDPFSGLLKDGEIWGRGTLDTKSTLLGIMESIELLIKSQFIPENDIYMSFAGDEEVSGTSAQEIVKYLKENSIKPEMVLDEGGAIVSDVFPGVKQSAALIGTCEKGYIDLLIKGQSSGGHASAPPRVTLNQKIAKSILNIERKQMKSHLTEPVRIMFDRLGRYSSFSYKLIFANMWLFSGLLKRMFIKQGGQMNALITTTMAGTMLQGSKAFNVLPSDSSIGVNCRILEVDTIDSCIDHIKKNIDQSFEVEIVESREPSPITSIDTNSFQLVERIIAGMHPDVIVSPYLMTGGTDSRHFCEICDNVLRFAPYRLNGEELSLIHSNNERIKISSILETVQFYIQLVTRL